jgi:hypothetical protein
MAVHLVSLAAAGEKVKDPPPAGLTGILLKAALSCMPLNCKGGLLAMFRGESCEFGLCLGSSKPAFL